MSKTPEHPTSIRLSSDLRETLLRLAEADGRSLTNYIVNVLRLHVEGLRASGSKSGKPRKP